LLSGGSDVWTFITAPQLHPMKVGVQTQQPGTAPGLTFVSPYSLSENPSQLVGETGPLMMDKSGNPVWFLPVSSNNRAQAMDFQSQTLFGQPVLTWWQGTIAGTVPSPLPDGEPMPGGRYIIENSHYQKIMNIKAKNGFSANEHEFLITPQGDAVFVASKVAKADLTPYGGVKRGVYVDCEVQEVNLRSGKLVFTWDMAKHIPLSDSLVPAPGSAGQVWDPYHMNSIDVSPDGSQLLVSSRNTWTVYDISHQTGQILWRIGGKENQFSLPSELITGPYGSAFQYQHDARYVPGGISLFDDAGLGSAPTSGPYGAGRGMVLNLEVNTLTARLQSPLDYHDPVLRPSSQGDVQTVMNGDHFVGWGSDVQSDGSSNSYYSEFTAGGTMIYDVLMPGENVSYRAFSDQWVGFPLTKPAAVVTQAGGQRTVYASWNGATEDAAWELLAGPNRSSLTPVSITSRTGFQTPIPMTVASRFYKVRALAADGAVLGSSAVIAARP
jgi:hypothetical protein